MNTEKKDWEMLRDEIVANDMNAHEALEKKIDDYRKEHNITTSKEEEEFASIMFGGLTYQSRYAEAKSEIELADMLEGKLLFLVYYKFITKDMMVRYNDFFMRLGLESDYDKVMADAETKYKWEKDHPETVPPVFDFERRREICREYRRNIGTQLKAMREKRGYSMRYVEEKTGISHNIISRTEAGRANTTIDTLAILVDFYEIGIPLEISKFTSIYPIQKLNI
ncbi:MAG: helix-turn-helix transcriptional regulator [Bacteroides sp.]|nr:helix-turn-helix transcriptional regulator [Bacteroides sp.]